MTTENGWTVLDVNGHKAKATQDGVTTVRGRLTTRRVNGEIVWTFHPNP